MNDGLALQVQDLVAGYTPELNILRGITLHVARGEIVTLLGPNGAGKSTLMKAVAGLVPVRSGAVQLFGRSLVGVPTHQVVRRGLAYVPQTDNVFVRLSVQENVELGAPADHGRHDAGEDLERMFTLFPRLKERRRQRAGTLSGGERQMVAVARALMARPQLLMLDEPSAGLAPALVQMVFDKLREVRALGVTLLIVEQNARVSLAISDRGMVLAEGQVRLSAGAAELLDSPEVGALFMGTREGST